VTALAGGGGCLLPAARQRSRGSGFVRKIGSRDGELGLQVLDARGSRAEDPLAFILTVGREKKLGDALLLVALGRIGHRLGDRCGIC
jgi:hypothetical protein